MDIDKKIMMILIAEMENKLKEFMSEEEYHSFSVNLARNAFKQEVEGMADSPFKQFVLQNFDKITEEEGD